MTDSEGAVSNKTNHTLSIVIPAFNEADRIAPTLDNIFLFSRRSVGPRLVEVIVVDDGSSDNTSEVVASYIDRLPLRIFKLPTNRGKGAALRVGVLNSCGSRVLFADADGSTLLEDITRLETWLDKGFDIAFGSRALSDKEVRVAARLHRRVIGRTFHLLASFVLPKGIVDSQCGFKLFTQEAAQALFQRAKCDGFSFDVELLWLAAQLRMKWKEVPVNWTHRPNSKLNLLSAPISMFFEICSILCRRLKNDTNPYFTRGYMSDCQLTLVTEEGYPNVARSDNSKA